VELSPHNRAALLDVASRTIRGAVTGSTAEFVEPTEPQLTQPAGCFVSLHERGTHRLRGCIGRMDATQPLWQAVQRAALGVLDDPRFPDERIRPDELSKIDLEISVISPLRDAPSPLTFDLLNDGIYLIVNERSGCFLPQVARETGWSKEQLLDRLCTEKMALPPDAWRRAPCTLKTFGTLIVGPVAL
jgi:AmmeMemoRadiSam system protein A